jgi:7-cyano-7-deazaguanine synthase in queuosine biosynthesis
MLQHFPVLLQKQQSLTKDYTFRSRSFVFASLAAAISHMLGKQRILMCENGIVSMNLPIARQLVGARSSRTTHPKALACFGLLFETLFEKDPPRVENPLFWRTKAEVVQLIGNYGCSHLIDSTVSCSHVHEITTKQPHCGECSQCVDRRFGVLGAGLEEHDPEAKYRHRLLLDEWNPGEPRTLAESYIRSAIDTRNASTETLYARFAGELSRAVQFMPGDRDSSARQLIAMQQRHATSVFSILEQEVRRHASGLLDGSLPAHCLLRMAVSSHSELRHAADRDPSPTGELSATSDGRRLKDGLVAPEIQIAVNDAARIVHARGGLEFKGADYNFLRTLLHVFEEDLRNQMAPENYRYTRTRALATKLNVGQPTVHQRVLRIRNRLFAWFVEDYPLPQDALIENAWWNGYRINPAIRLLSLSEMAGADQASRSCERTVTT